MMDISNEQTGQNFGSASTKLKRYIAFLRGINISGKCKVPMAELREGFETLEFIDVKTYRNSGNVIFSSKEDCIKNFTNRIETMLKSRFAFDVPVFVMAGEELEEVLQRAPDWWGNENNEIYDNIIFIMPPATFAEVFNEIGEPKIEFERIKGYKDVIFWSFNRKEYQKTNWWAKTASVNMKDKLTIRTANTVRAIAGM